MLLKHDGILKCGSLSSRQQGVPCVRVSQSSSRHVRKLNNETTKQRTCLTTHLLPAATGRGSQPVQASAIAEERGQDARVIVDQTFTLPKGGLTVQVTVSRHDDGAQTIRSTTPLQAGRLLLHWGVEGGRDYKGGWRLPGPACRPPGTVQYKDRALQTPFVNKGSYNELIIELTADEASDLMNFVLKDDATNNWWDNNGSNFRVPLKQDADVASQRQIETLPKALCDKWAWTRWDMEGRPQRSEQQANDDYDRGVAEMKELLAKGRTLDELWRVAEGKWRYSDYREKVIKPLVGDAYRSARRASTPPVERPQTQLPHVPDELVGVQAYVLWERAGKPAGADFSRDARDEIERQLMSGKTLGQIAQQLNYPYNEPAVQRSGSYSESPVRSPTPQPVTSPAAATAQVGKPLGTPTRNPLSMIKQQSQAPVLSAEKAARQELPLDFLVQAFAIDPSTKWRRKFSLGDKSEVLVVVRQEDGNNQPVRVDFFSDLPNMLVLHWGVSKPGQKEWLMPPSEVWPAHSQVTGQACETDFVSCEDEDEECNVVLHGAKVPLQKVSLEIPAESWIGGLTLVLRSSDNTMWYKDAGSNFHIPVPCSHAPELDISQQQDSMAQLNDDLSKAIVDAEVNTSQWTLMHRFNKAADLINEVLNGYYDMDVADAFGRIYVWLRYSATRKLTWQRNYNTQPRILSAAQERLTNTIANAHSRTTGEAQEWVRLMLATVGRGGDGQKIRDEILNIMHRNHIPEKKGLWMEEWHQKLHNNTTPDDVPICEAYLAYLEKNGDLSAYWRVLSDAGITRQRLEGFDRPITLEPQWFDGKREALINDFRNYLGILKAVHSGADLQSSSAAAGNKIPGGARGYLGYVLSHRNDNQILPLLEAAVEARTELAPVLPGNRELLYLDLALEDQVRAAAERGVGSAGFGAAAYMRPLLQNLALSLGNNEEICYCLKAWQELPASIQNGGRPSKEEALQAVAVINRIRRAISEVSDSIVMRIGDVGRLMGEAFSVEAWARDLFAEEVVRGGPAFAVSLLITSIEASLRNAAALGAWQVISPQEVTGVVVVVENLHSVQDKTYDVPTVLVAHQVTGEEEIPEGAVAVLTPDAPDVLSHVSVRARNMRVLFATCHDAEPLNQIKAAAGSSLHFCTTASGSVTWAEAKAQDGQASGHAAAPDKPTKGLQITVPEWSGKWVVNMDEYNNGVVGAKSKNLAGLRGKLPGDIKLPSSVTLPFGCFEQVLDLPENREIKRQITDLVATLTGRKPGSSGGVLGAVTSLIGGGEHSSHNGLPPGVEPADVLAKCRAAAMQVKVPDVIRKDLAAAMSAAGIPVPENEKRWEMAMAALKGVWASKYNDRAYYSLRKVGLNFDDVRMAVLVQRVVPAQYAFVIHTRNPSNNDESEVFCELVQGLGESLVSGMVAGSAVAFKAPKGNLDSPEVLCYASKSEGMFVRESLIFRSDSNGEDLEGYAGAGLYESITMDPTETRRVDYMSDRLVKDPNYRREVLARICKVGANIEKALGSAQDIEGVVAPDGSITVVQTRPQV